MKETKNKIMGLFLALAMLIACLPLNPILTYADDGVKIDEANFPDEIFRWYVSWFDKDKDGTLSQKELDAVQKMDLSFYNFHTYRELDIKNLKGIEYFKNLKKLQCVNNNNLTSLDLSKNTALTELICIGTKLTSLDLSNNTALTKLDCYENQLSSLVLGENKVLTELDCYNNQLTSLDLSKNTALTELNCYNNQLTSINLSENTSLTKLACFNNQLTSLDLSKNTALTELNCDRNQLTGLDLSGNAALTILYCCENQLTSLDVSKNTTLTKLICFNNQLINLDLSKNTNLVDLECSNNKITKLDLSKNTIITNLHCKNNRLTSLDVSNNTALTKLDCEGNQLTNLDLSKNTALNDFECSNNKITKLDLKNNINLGGLNCSENQLTNLDLSQNAYLYLVKCHSNYLTNLNLSNNTHLYYLGGKNNPLTYVKLPEENPNEDSDEGIEKELSPVTYTVRVAEGSSKIPFTALPQGFYKDKIDGPITGADLEADGFKWDRSTNPIKFQYQLCDNPKEIVEANLKIIILPVAKSDHSTFIPLRISAAKTIKLKVKLVIGSKEMIKSIDGIEERITMDVAPFIKNGRTMLPIRFIAEALDFNVVWDNDQRTVVLIDKENVVKIPVATNKIIVNGKEYESDVKPVLKNNRTMLPIANIARALGLEDGKDIIWDASAKEVIITRKVAK
ncbi:hypothetical protein LV469_08585 [Peptoniphilus sp. GNH]|nr:hypothetical protein LV469_08585 [Peptoniphilus sp. GNH]